MVPASGKLLGYGNKNRAGVLRGKYHNASNLQSIMGHTGRSHHISSPLEPRKASQRRGHLIRVLTAEKKFPGSMLDLAG